MSAYLDPIVKRILILFAHPRFEKSRMNRALIEAVEGMPQVTLHDLYERYPDFDVDVRREQELLASHEVIVWQHPFYMYGAPALLKQWLDLVLEYGWAHGPGAKTLKGKFVFTALSTGGSRESYTAGGSNRFTLREFLRPFDQTAALCGMRYLPPFAVQGTHRLTEVQLAKQAALYRLLLTRLSGEVFDPEPPRRYALLNDWLEAHPGEPPP
jgi:glutathione-regulated potassium-efflux system ancillary protein KefG